MEQMREALVAMKGLGIYGEIPGGVSYQTGYGIPEISASSPTVLRIMEFVEEYSNRRICDI